MATRAAEQLAKAREALKARSSGTTEAFLEKSRLEKAAQQLAKAASDASTANPVAPVVQGQNHSVEVQPASNPFAGLRPPKRVEADELDQDSFDGHGSEKATPASGRPLATISFPTPSLAPAPAPTQALSAIDGQAEADTAHLPQSTSSPPVAAKSPRPVAPRALAATSPAVEPTLPSAPHPVWPDRRVPPGSSYTFDEWEAARSGGKFHVMEIRAGSEGALFQVLAAPAVASPKRSVIDGKVTAAAPVQPGLAESDQFIDPAMGSLLDGCLLLGPKAPTSHPHAATASFAISMPDGKPWNYRVARPEAHRDDPYLRALFEMTGSLPFQRPDYEQVPATLNPWTSHHVDATPASAVVPAPSEGAESKAETLASPGSTLPEPPSDPSEETGLFDGDDDFASQVMEAERDRIRG